MRRSLLVLILPLCLVLVVFVAAGTIEGPAPAGAQLPSDKVDLVILVDRSGDPPDPAAMGRMQDLLTLWASVAGPRDRVGLLQVGGAPRWLTSGLLRMDDLDGRAALRQSLRRAGPFERRDGDWAAAVDRALRELERLSDPSPYQGLLALVRGDPTTAPNRERLASAAARLQGPPSRPFYGLSLEGGVARLNASVGAASGGWVETTSSDWVARGLRMAAALSPHRWVAQIQLLPGIERSVILPRGTAWAAFVVIRPDPTTRLVQLAHGGEDWLGPAMQRRSDRVQTDRLEIVTLLTPGDYSGEWRVRIEGSQEATLGLLIGLREPLLPLVPGAGRRWIIPAEGPLYVEAEIPSLLSQGSISAVFGEEAIPLADDGGAADRQAGDSRAGGLSAPSSWGGISPEGAFRLAGEDPAWEQPVWLEPREDLPTLQARVTPSPTHGLPITITVERPAGVEEVVWRWVGWRIGNSDWMAPERAEAAEAGWEWVVRATGPGAARFMGLAEVRLAPDRRPSVYMQAVTADFTVVSPMEGRLAVAPEALPDRLGLPGRITLIITSTLDRPAQIRIAVEDPMGRVEVLPTAFRIPAREVIRQVVELRGGGEPRTVHLRLRAEEGVPLDGGEIRVAVAASSQGSPVGLLLCLLAFFAGGALAFIIRILSRRSRERWR